ncbi:MAG: ABC transporter permease [Ferruginibacter sp.]|nr:ABC transporter permease [Chitinophagaceae bacterium]MBP6287456.1 ABC transporter permease [Ferruginibacter sp.]MBU9935691.1 ABC transporter permease [Ferruginibacter sp.]
MKKILLIIQREFLTRVRKKTFIIGTILFPLLYLGLIFGTGYIAEKSRDDLKIAVIDRSGLFTENLVATVNREDSSNAIKLITSNSERFKTAFDSLGYDGYIEIPESFSWQHGTDSLVINTKKSFGIGAANPVERKINQVWNRIKHDSLGIDSAKDKILNKTLALRFHNEKNKNANEKTATVIGYVCGLLMYLILLLYGSQVMMGVTEEKTSRIAEVVVSSVKPFQLMIGKIVGIGMVALTQFLIWVACIFIIYNVSKTTGNAGGNVSGMVGAIQEVFTSVNMPLVVGCFIFYLLAGFFFYSSLYAAIGSAINEDMREAQSLSFPITMLVIFSIALMTPAISNPGSSLAVWASIIPFSSPIVMMARIPFGVPVTVPWWQLGLSMVLLIAGFMFTTWFAARIYRTGILMYGKKPSWKEMMKWAFRK